MENKQLTLPVSVISPTDVARLTREVESLDEFFRQSEIRQGGQPQSLPRYSRLLDEVVVANDLNLLDKTNRNLLVESFNQLQMTAPVMHISFSVDPPGSYVQKIVGWLRQNIDGLVLVRVGLMPNIGAGCVVRTTNKSFDFSLRKYFDSKHEFFMNRLHKVVAPDEDETIEIEQPKSEDQNQQIGVETPIEEQGVVQDASIDQNNTEPTEEPQKTQDSPESVEKSAVVGAEEQPQAVGATPEPLKVDVVESTVENAAESEPVQEVNS